MPYLEWVRENVFMRVSNILAKQFELNVNNVYTFLILLVSFWLAGKIVGKNYNSVEGRWGYLAVITATLFFVLKMLGAGN